MGSPTVMLVDTQKQFTDVVRASTITHVHDSPCSVLLKNNSKHDQAFSLYTFPHQRKIYARIPRSISQITGILIACGRA